LTRRANQGHNYIVPQFVKRPWPARQRAVWRDPSRAGTEPVLPPMDRFVEASEVAALTAFLLSPEAGAITGQQIVICAGASL